MSTNYSFVKTPEEIAAALRCGQSADFYEQEKIQVFWTIDEALARKILPPHMEPFMPYGVPVVTAYVAHFGRPEFLYPYTEGALFLLAKCEDKAGVYCLAMPLDACDQAMDSGRQFYGYPKKQAFVKMERRGDKLYGYIERNDIRYFEVEMTIGEPVNHPALGDYAVGKDGPQETVGDVLLLKYEMDSTQDDTVPSNFRNIRVHAQKNVTKFLEKQKGHVDRMEFRPSEDDPWIELAPKSDDQILGGYYARFETYMKPSTLVYQYDKSEYESLLPYMWTAWDTSLLGKAHRSHRTENFWH